MATKAPRSAKPKRQLILDWRPQPRQLDFLRAAGLATMWGYPSQPVAQELFMGGSAYGGKTDALMGGCMNRALTTPLSRIIYFRRTFRELSMSGGIIDRTLSVLPQVLTDGTPVYRWLKSEHKLEFWNGATWMFAHLQHEDDKHDYQGAQVDLVVFDELTHFTETQYLYFNASRVRPWTSELKTFPMRLAASNPGSIGHGWVKARFVSAHKWGESFTGDDGMQRIFIPARISDNKIGTRNAPDYERGLDALPEADRRALKDGDWDSYAGQFFSEWSRRTHVIDPFPIPEHWPRFCAYDFGYGAAAVHLWFAVDPATELAYCYREYATVREKSEGKFDSYKALVVEQAQEILRKERESDNKPPEWRVADPSIFNDTQANTGEAVSETFANNGIHFEKADNRRIMGWQRVHAWLKPLVDEDKQPVLDEHGPIAPLRFFNTCRYTISTIPSLPHDLKNPEDLDTHAEDHPADTVRYYCMNRPEPVALTPYRFAAKRKPKPTQHQDIIDDYEDDTPPTDERGLLMPVDPRRKSK